MIRRLIVVSVLAATGCAHPVVGGRCVEGYVAVNGECIAMDLYDAGSGDGSVGTPDGALDGGPGSDAGGDAGPRDGGPVVPGVCDLGELACGGGCVRPDVDVLHCGACDAACSAGELCAAGVCASTCEAPLLRCDGLCIDVSGDPDNCGGCGVRCESGICIDGECADPMAGHVVAVGHDYVTGRRGMNRIAGNAVFLAPGDPVRVLAYAEHAEDPSITGVDRAVDQVARERGRSWERSIVPADELTYKLASADVLLVYPQTLADDATLDELGTTWARALDRFLARGGVVALFEGGGPSTGTHRLLEAAGLMVIDGRVEVTAADVVIEAPADAVALGVPLAYRPEDATWAFSTAETIVVARHALGPIVVHRVVLPSP